MNLIKGIKRLAYLFFGSKAYDEGHLAGWKSEVLEDKELVNPYPDLTEEWLEYERGYLDGFELASYDLMEEANDTFGEGTFKRSTNS